MINNNKTIASKPFEYQAKLIERMPNNKLDAEVVVALNYLSNLWRSLDLPSTLKQNLIVHGQKNV